MSTYQLTENPKITDFPELSPSFSLGFPSTDMGYCYSCWQVNIVTVSKGSLLMLAWAPSHAMHTILLWGLHVLYSGEF